MRSPFSFIVKPSKGLRYDNIREYGDVNFITSVSKEDHTVSNRFAEVVSTPLGYKGGISNGDVLLVHHNVFKFYYDMKGREKSGKSFFKDDLFFIDEDQFFLYRSKNEWTTHSKYCFVKPLKALDSVIYKNTTNEPLMGTLIYGNKDLSKLGVNKGDIVSYTPNSEYEFEVDGVKLYRMFTNNITLVHENKQAV